MSYELVFQMYLVKFLRYYIEFYWKLVELIHLIIDFDLEFVYLS